MTVSVEGSVGAVRLLDLERGERNASDRQSHACTYVCKLCIMYACEMKKGIVVQKASAVPRR